MHLRRALLLFAVVLTAAAIASLLAPRKRQATTDQVAAPAPSPAAGTQARAVRLSYPLHAAARTLRVASGEHVQLEVGTSVPGDASAFGAVASAEALTPARFDVLAPG